MKFSENEKSFFLKLQLQMRCVPSSNLGNRRNDSSFLKTGDVLCVKIETEIMLYCF